MEIRKKLSYKMLLFYLYIAWLSYISGIKELMLIAIPGIAIFGTYFILSIKRFRSLIIKYEGEIITCENEDTKEIEIINRKDVLDVSYVGRILYIVVDITKGNKEKSCRIIPVSFFFTTKNPEKVSRKLRRFIR